MRHEDIQHQHLPVVLNRLAQNNDPYPKVIEIHPTDGCNQKCTYCFRSAVDFSNDVLPGILTIDEYASMFSEMNELDIREISISGGGDPFFDGRTTSILNLAHRNNLNSRVITNGVLLRENDIEELTKSKEVRFSLDAINPQTYSKIRKVPGKQHSIAIQNLKKILDLRRTNGSKTSVGVTFLVNSHNYREIGDFSRYMTELGVDAIIIKHDIYDGHNIPEESIEEAKNVVLGIDNPRIHFREPLDMKIKGIRCFVPYFKTAFNPYGDLYSCCLGSQPGEKNGYLLGNFHSKTIRRIWEDSRELRKKIRSEGVNCINCNYTDYKINLSANGDK